MEAPQPPHPYGTPFLRVVALLLFAFLIAVLSSLGTYYFLQYKGIKDVSVDRPGPGPVFYTSPTPAQPVNVSPTVDPTTNWKTYTNPKWQFSLKYPPTWSANPCDNSTSFFFLLGPTKDSTGLCNSGFGGQMSVFVENGNTVVSHSLTSPDFTNIKTEQLSVNDVRGQRMSGIGDVSPDKDPVHGGNKGTTEIIYVFYTNGKTYSIGYSQTPSGSLSQNVSSDFDLMVKNTLKFSP